MSTSWANYQDEIKKIDKGFKDMVQNGKLDDYNIMFREKPPEDVINWLNSNNIPWENYV